MDMNPVFRSADDSSPKPPGPKARTTRTSKARPAQHAAPVSLPGCARAGCGHPHAAHAEQRAKAKGKTVLKCALCACRHYLEPNGRGPRPTAPNADKTYPAEVLTVDEVHALINGCNPKVATGIRNRAILTVLYMSGLRVSELTALKPSGVNLEAHTLRVLHGKGDKATTRGFHPTATDALAFWLDKRHELALKNGWRNGTLFCTLDGGPVHEQYLRNLLHRLALKAGIDKRVHPHGLRHTFANELRARGVDPVVISKLLGHSSIAVTVRYLDHVTNHDAVAALAAVDMPPIPPPAGVRRRRGSSDQLNAIMALLRQEVRDSPALDASAADELIADSELPYPDGAPPVPVLLAEARRLEAPALFSYIEPMRPDGLVTAREIAEAIGVPVSAVTQAGSRGALKVVRDGRNILFDPARLRMRKSGLSRVPVDRDSKDAAPL